MLMNDYRTEVCRRKWKRTDEFNIGPFLALRDTTLARLPSLARKPLLLLHLPYSSVSGLCDFDYKSFRVDCQVISAVFGENE